MDIDIDHYKVLGLPSGEEGAKLSVKEISKAYKWKALELHPDKRPDDPSAHDNFQKLKTSYEILKDEKARKMFDELLRVRLVKLQRQSQQNSKRRKMMSDLEERERAAFDPDPADRAKDEEERISRKLKEEITRIRAMHSNKVSSGASGLKKQTTVGGKDSTDCSQSGTDKDKVLKVSWEKVGEDYSSQRLRELFQQFGEVEDVVIRSTKKKGSALVVMATKDAAVAALGTMCGDLSNPLLVLPLQPAVPFAFPSAQEPVVPERDAPRQNLVGAGYQAFESSVLEKLKKEAAEELAPRLEVILQHLMCAYGKYQRRNPRIVYDAIGTLADAVGGELNQILMPPLIAKWQQLSNSDKDIFPHLECFTSIAQALGTGFSPFAPPVFQRLILLQLGFNLIRSSLFALWIFYQVLQKVLVVG